MEKSKIDEACEEACEIINCFESITRSAKEVTQWLTENINMSAVEAVSFITKYRDVDYNLVDIEWEIAYIRELMKKIRKIRKKSRIVEKKMISSWQPREEKKEITDRFRKKFKEDFRLE
jgi:hypothetical protein